MVESLVGDPEFFLIILVVSALLFFQSKIHDSKEEPLVREGAEIEFYPVIIFWSLFFLCVSPFVKVRYNILILEDPLQIFHNEHSCPKTQ
jgi:hypothetical protein